MTRITPTRPFSKMRSLPWYLVASAMLLALPGIASAQLDTRHWVPPTLGYGRVANHCLFLSTPEASAVPVTVYDGVGEVVWSGSVDHDNPVKLTMLGSCGTGQTLPNGSSGIRHALLGASYLNQVLDEGLFVEAEQSVYANLRHTSTNQGTSATAKGRKALGTEFRAGFPYMYDNNRTDEGIIISVMATEDDTAVTFDGFKPGVVLEGVASSGSPATAEPFSIILDANESYIVGIRDSYFPNTVNINDINGIRITSDRPVAALSGAWMQGPTSKGRDICLDQMVPSELAGVEFVLMRGNGGTGYLESPIVVATEDDTEVFVNGDVEPYSSGQCPSPMAAGEYCVLTGNFVGDAMLVETSRPALMYQTMGGSTSGATPGMNVVPQLSGSLQTAVDPLAEVNYLGSATLGVITRADADVTVNGLAPGATAQTVPGTDEWVIYKQTGLTGDVAIESTASLAVALVNLNGLVGAAGYFSGFPPTNLDLDEDGVPDGDDNCPDVANPFQDDYDGDGVGDECDECWDDPMKSVAGACGCGVPEGDDDGDGVECTDNCPYTYNPDQGDADFNGRGDACEDDGDGDGIPDPLDDCPEDPDKSEPGDCGCGVPDTDSDLDGYPNCIDDCPADANKIDPGNCGCGETEDCGPPDDDGDGVPNDEDLCPGFDDNADADADGTPDACDACPQDYFNDSDGDGSCDSDDLCPLDADDDIDLDGYCADEDVCPLDPDNDADLDGICGDLDICPDDPDNDGDFDGLCAGDDPCPLDYENDADFDGICGDVDACPYDDENDYDGDGVCGDVDDCPYDAANDADGDGVCGDVDACPGGDDNADADGDGTADFCDVCPYDAANDADGDGLCGDVDPCPMDYENDADADGICGDEDICPYDAENDADLDGMCGDVDVCPYDADNDADSDGLCGDVDPCPLDYDNDWDGDGICGDVDICPFDADNDIDSDGVCGDVDPCPIDPENDADGDGFCESDDNCPTIANANQSNADGDEYGDACEPDNDDDGTVDDYDNCPLDWNEDQADFDNDGFGDVCDADVDGDGVIDASDTCLETDLDAPVLPNGCSWEQECVCEAQWKNHGAYVSCVAHATNDLRDAGLITEEEKGEIQSEAGQSDCGDKGNNGRNK